MFDATLYLVIRRSPEIDKKMRESNPKLLALLGLEEIEAGGLLFIGKRTPPHPSLEELTNLENHLRSVMQRLQLKCSSPFQIVSIFS